MEAQAVLVWTKTLRRKVHRSCKGIKKHIREEAEVGRAPTPHSAFATQPSPLTPDDLQSITEAS